MTQTTPLMLGTLLLMASSTLAQTEVDKLSTNAGRTGDRLGTSAAFDGTTALLGAPDDRVSGLTAGSVFVFEDKGSGWNQVQRLNRPTLERNDDFGTSVDLDGSFAIVGAPLVDLPGGGGGLGNPTADWGAAYIFQQDMGGNWSFDQELRASDDDPFDYFGTAVAISGDTVVVGARGANLGGIIHAGAAYVFVRGGGGSWSQQAKLTASDGSNLDAFGLAVDIDGDRIVVGSHVSDGIVAGAGSAYVFERSGSSWSQTTKLVASDGLSGDRYGGSVSMDDDLIVVGARGADPAGMSGAGAAYANRLTGGSWVEEAKILPGDLGASDLFGSSIAIVGERVGIGAVNSNGFTGAAYVFDRSGGSWSETAKLTADDGDSSDSFGGSIAFDGSLFLVGAAGGDGVEVDSGVGYLFSLGNGLGTPYCFCDVGICSNPDANAGCENTTGSGALLAASGSASTSADDLTLSTTSLASNQFGLIFMGAGQTASPFGDGQRCVTAGGIEVYRFPIRNSGAGATLVESGIVGTSQSFNSNGQIAAGQTWNFQAWYRDPGGPCSTAFNLSNGVSITFLP